MFISSFATILPAGIRRRISPNYWNRRMTLQQANAFAPDPPFILGTPMMSFHTNFELFVKCKTSPQLILKICDTFQSLFMSGRVTGRMELRCGTNKQFIDLDLVRGESHHVITAVRKIYGKVAMQLHPGKAQIDLDLPN